MAHDHDIAVIPGDGIGPAVVDAALPVVRAAADEAGVGIDTTRYDWGTERYRETGAFMPDEGLERLATHDGVLLGAVGHPDVPDHVTLHGLLLPIRKGFDHGICRRPTRLFDGIEPPLRGYDGGEIDFTVFRENTEGEYADVGGREHVGLDNDVAVQSAVFTRRSTERVVRAAFETAATRDGHVTNITKSNAQAHSMVFWDEIVREVSEEYPGVETERLLVDAAAMDLVRRPEAFDVLVASNLFGDVLTDLAAAITGSLGLAPSANVDPSGDHPPMCEPVHGSAPDIVGDGVANPLGTVLAAAMLMDELGTPAVGDALRTAVAEQLRGGGPRTPDVGGDAGTERVASDLRDRI